jgi:hypothetical protein
MGNPSKRPDWRRGCIGATAALIAAVVIIAAQEWKLQTIHPETRTIRMCGGHFESYPDGWPYCVISPNGAGRPPILFLEPL